MDLRDELATLVREFSRSLDAARRRGQFAVSGRVAATQHRAAQDPSDAVETATSVVVAPRADGFAARSLPMIRADLGDCQRCGLAAGRQHIVFGAGAANASLVFVGEGPGADEDRTGEPFVGRAGELLTKMIGAMGWRRDDVYICNVIKCRPPDNRTPLPEEVAACSPFLLAQLDAIAPRLIVALGRPAANMLLENDAPISALRGKLFTHRGFRILPTFHPAYLLRQPEKKREAWADLQLAMQELGRMGIAPGGKAG